MESTSSTVISQTAKPRRNRARPYVVFAQVALFAWAVLIASWGTVSFVVLPLVMLAACSIACALNFAPVLWNRVAAYVAWISSLIVFARFFGSTASYSIDPYYVEFCAIVALATSLTCLIDRLVQFDQAWRWLSFFWAGTGTLIWLCFGYNYNFAGHFFAALGASVVLLIALKTLLKIPGWGHQVINTVLLLLIFGPILDWFTRPKYNLDIDSALRNRAYSCEVAKGDPVAYKEWWYYYMSQWHQMGGYIFMKDPAGVLPFRLKPSSDGPLFHATIHVNALGFRGKEISKDKGDAYRIVALGESTTFGCTLEPQNRPWPEVLEQLINERIKPSRPVQVINAGVPSYDILCSLYRLRTEILGLKPDMIVTYHGVNGFSLIQDGLPTVIGKTPPRFEERPIRLLADCEYSVKVRNYRRHYAAQPVLRPVSKADALKSKYAQAYRDLIDLAHTNHVRLAIANFSMAVNEQTKPDVAKFYDMTYPVYPTVKANVAHSLVVETLTHEHPDVCLIDTHPHLDGEHEKFIDEVHLTQEGRDQLAENIYAGLEKTLREDLKRSSAPDVKTASK